MPPAEVFSKQACVIIWGRCVCAAVLLYVEFWREKRTVPNIKSAIKRVAVAERNNVRNRFWKSTMRSARTKVEEALTAKSAADTTEALKGVLHKNAGNRRKSRLALRLAKLQPQK